MIGALFGLFAAAGLPLAVLIVVTVIIAGWAVSGAYLAREISKRLEP
jgi:hypothetical protein